MRHNHELMLKGQVVTQRVSMKLGLECNWPARHYVSGASASMGSCDQFMPSECRWSEVWASSVEKAMLFSLFTSLIENGWSSPNPLGWLSFFYFRYYCYLTQRLAIFIILDSFFLNKKNNRTGNMHNLWTDKWEEKNVKEVVNMLGPTVIGNWELMQEIKIFLLLGII